MKQPVFKNSMMILTVYIQSNIKKSKLKHLKSKVGLELRKEILRKLKLAHRWSLIKEVIWNHTCWRYFISIPTWSIKMNGILTKY